MKIQPGLIPRFNNDYNFNDFIYGIKSIFSKKNNDLRLLSEIFGQKTFFFTNNGRSSLYIILRSLNLPAGSRVGVPLYSCTVVFDAIIKAGYIPSFIDIDINTYTIDPRDLEKKIQDLSAVIVMHTFGHPADIDEIKRVTKEIPIIEDCAHSMLSEYNGKITGTLGNVSFFSLGKYISAGGGGMIVLNDNELKENMKKEISFLDSPTILCEIKHSFFVYIFSFLYKKPWFGLFAFHLGSAIDKKINISDKKGFEATKIKKSDISVFWRKFKKFREKVELQRRNSSILLNELRNMDIILPHERKKTLYNHFLFPILFDSKEKRNKVSEILRNMNIDSVKLFSMTPKIARQFYEYNNNCPNTEKFADRILIIPNYYTLTSKELLTITNIIRKIGDLK